MAPKRALRNIFGTQKVGDIFEISPLVPLLRRPWSRQSSGFLCIGVPTSSQLTMMLTMTTPTIVLGKGYDKTTNTRKKHWTTYDGRQHPDYSTVFLPCTTSLWRIHRDRTSCHGYIRTLPGYRTSCHVLLSSQEH